MLINSTYTYILVDQYLWRGGKVYNLSEKFYDFVRRCKENDKPFCYISCNYGPYQTQEYFELSKKNFKDCTDICFRDKYSYNLFKDIETVRYAPDFAFSYEKNQTSKIQGSVGISVIDLSIRNDLKDKQEEYIKFLTKNIDEYLSIGKKVYLYSFCESEGDERTINNILSKFPNDSNVITVRYKGNVDEFLDLYSKMEYMICARFHAMILSSVFKQKMYIMSYSKKIDNVIEDLNLDLPILHFDNFKKDIYLNLEDFIGVEKNRLTQIIEASKGQESAIKNIL